MDFKMLIGCLGLGDWGLTWNIYFDVDIYV